MNVEILIRLIADIAVIPIALLGVYALLFLVKRGKRFETYSRVLLAGLTAYMIAKFVAFVYQPSALRPFELLGVDPGASYLNNPGFPSDHALFVTAIVLAVWFSTKNKTITAILAGLAILVCIGRVVALVHTPLDVIGGVVIAFIGALWYSNVPRRQEVHGNGKSHSKRN